MCAFAGRVLLCGPAIALLFAACATPERRELLPVPLPDLSRSDAIVQRQLRDRHAALATKQQGGASDTDLGRAYGELGLILHAAEYLDAAEPAYLNAQTLLSQEARWPYHLAHLYKSTGDTTGAAEAFRRVLSLRPEDVPTLVWLGRLYLDEGRAGDAEPLFDKARAVAPRSIAALAGLGQSALAKGDYARAAQLLEEAVQIDQRTSTLYAPLATAYRGLGDAVKADAAMKRWTNTEVPFEDPWTVERTMALESGISYESRGVAAFEAGRWTEAAGHFSAGLALTPHATPLGRSLRQKLALALYLGGDPRAALDQYEEAIRLAPAAGPDEPAAQAHYGLGVILASGGRQHPAIDHLRKALEYDQNYVQAHTVLADLLRTERRFEEALTHYRQAIETNPQAVEARLGYALALARLGRYAAATQWLEASVALQPDRPELAHALARMLAAAPDARARNGPRALALAERLLQSGKRTDVGETLAMALAELGRFGEAAAIQRDVIRAAERAGPAGDLRRMAANLARYEKGQPARTPWPDDDAIHRPGPPVNPELAALLAARNISSQN